MKMKHVLSVLLSGCTMLMLAAYMLLIFGFGHGAGIMILTLVPLSFEFPLIVICAMGWLGILLAYLGIKCLKLQEYACAATIQLFCAVDLFCAAWLFYNDLADREGKQRGFIDSVSLTSVYSYFFSPALAVVVLSVIVLLMGRFRKFDQA